MAEAINQELTEDPQSYSLVGRGQPLHIQVKQAIVNLKCYFQQKNGWRIGQTIAEISEALKISYQAVKRVVYEERRTKTLAAPKSKGRVKKRFQFDTNDRQILIAVSKEVASRTKTATITDVIAFIKANKSREDIQQLKFKDCKSDNTFRKIFQTMGLKFGQINGKNVLMLKNMVRIKPQPEQEKTKPTPKPFKSSAKALSVRRQPFPSPPTRPPSQPTPQKLIPIPPACVLTPFPKGALIAVPVSKGQPIVKSVGSSPNPIQLGSVVMKSGSVQPKLVLSNKTLINSPNLSNRPGIRKNDSKILIAISKEVASKAKLSNKALVTANLSNSALKGISIKSMTTVKTLDNKIELLKAKQTSVSTPIVPIQSLRVGNPGHDYSRSNANNPVKNQLIPKITNIRNPNIIVLMPMSTEQSNSGSVSPRVVKLVKTSADTSVSAPKPQPLPIATDLKEGESILPSEPILFD